MMGVKIIIFCLLLKLLTRLANIAKLGRDNNTKATQLIIIRGVVCQYNPPCTAAVTPYAKPTNKILIQVISQ